MHIRRLILLVALTAATFARADVAPVGGEFQVNTFTAGDQFAPQVCSDSAGRFTVAWQSRGVFPGPGPDGSQDAIGARRFDAGGAPQGNEFLANSYTLGPQRVPSIAAAPDGDFVVAWEGGSYFFPQDGSESGAFLQPFAATGAALGPELRANTTIAGSQLAPAVAADAAGNFVVVWTSYPTYYGTEGGDGSRAGVFGQRFDGTGTPVGGEFQVNTYTTGSQRAPRVATEATGGFVVVWESGSYYSGQDGNRTGVFGQRFDAGGMALGGEFQVNTYTTGDQLRPAVAGDSGGGFVVAWESRNYYFGIGQDGDEGGVFAQRFDGTGTRLGTEFQVNSYTTGFQGTPAVAVDGGGNFAVVWGSSDYPVGEDGDRAGVFGQHFAATGDPLGEQFQVNSYTPGSQSSPSIASGPDGGFVVVWTSSGSYSVGGGQDGDRSGIFGQRLRTTRVTPPARLRGERLVLRDDDGDARKRRLTLRVRDAAVDPGDDEDPTQGGATLRIASATFDHTYVLPAANWRRLGSPGRPGGWGYRDRGLLSGPITHVVVRAGGIKVSGKGAQLQHTLPANPDPVRVVLRVGAAGVPRCLAFGGTVEFDPDQRFRAQNAPPVAPATCGR